MASKAIFVLFTLLVIAMVSEPTSAIACNPPCNVPAGCYCFAPVGQCFCSKVEPSVIAKDEHGGLCPHNPNGSPTSYCPPHTHCVLVVDMGYYTCEND